MSFLKKIALTLPAVRRVRTDLENRRIRADEFETANKVILERNEELQARLEFMKTQMGKALTMKDSAVLAESSLAANAEHYQSQLNIMTTKYEALKADFQRLEVENSILKLTNDDVLIRNANLLKAAKQLSKRPEKPIAASTRARKPKTA